MCTLQGTCSSVRAASLTNPRSGSEHCPNLNHSLKRPDKGNSNSLSKERAKVALKYRRKTENEVKGREKDNTNKDTKN